MISEGDIVVAVLPQSDGLAKLRPVLLLRELPGFGDFLVCGISTQTHQTQAGFDLILTQDEPYFSETGLRSTSVIRLNFLASIPLNSMKRHLGKIPSPTLAALQSNLASHLISRHQPPGEIHSIV